MHDCTGSICAHVLAVFQATGKELLAVSRSAVVIWGIIIGLACCMCTGGKLCWTPGLALILGSVFEVMAVTKFCQSASVCASHVQACCSHAHS